MSTLKFQLRFVIIRELLSNRFLLPVFLFFYRLYIENLSKKLKVSLEESRELLERWINWEIKATKNSPTHCPMLVNYPFTVLAAAIVYGAALESFNKSLFSSGLELVFGYTFSPEIKEKLNRLLTKLGETILFNHNGARVKEAAKELFLFLGGNTIINFHEFLY